MTQMTQDAVEKASVPTIAIPQNNTITNNVVYNLISLKDLFNNNPFIIFSPFT